jgi:hypothetical protein
MVSAGRKSKFARVPSGIPVEPRRQHARALALAERCTNLGTAPRPSIGARGWPQEMTMASFDDRRDAFEQKFAHDETLRFKAMARRNKLLGLWAAAELGKPDADAYAAAVVAADFEEAGDDDVLRKVKADFDAAGVATSEAALRAKMDEFLAQAMSALASAS